MDNLKDQNTTVHDKTTFHPRIRGYDLNGAIRKKAKEIYKTKGHKRGYDLENWLEAEKIVLGHLHSSSFDLQKGSLTGWWPF